MWGRKPNRAGGGRGRRRPGVEGLESRRLLAVTFTSYTTIPNFTEGAGSIADGPDGNLWFTANRVVMISHPVSFSYEGRVDSINPTTGAVAEYPTPTVGSGPEGIAAGPDGKLWFTESAADKVASIDPTTHAYAEYAIPTGSNDPHSLVAEPEGIVAGPDGNLWFTERRAGKIGTINPTTHAYAEYAVPTANSSPFGITVGDDGKLWFTETGAGKVASIDPTTHTIVEHALPSSLEVSAAIALGPDGNLWFPADVLTPAGPSNPSIADINPSTGVISTYSTGQHFVSTVTAGPDGQVWFTGSQYLAEINPTTHVITDDSTLHPLISHPTAIVTGPDKGLWMIDTSTITAARIIPTNQAAIVSNVNLDPAGDGSSSGGGLAGQTVFLDLKGDGTLDPGDPSAVTDSQGYFQFVGIAPGTYTVRVVLYPGDIATSPAGAEQTITVGGGQLGVTPTIGIVARSTVLPLAFDPAPFGSHNPDVATAEVDGLYRLILGRAADPAGLAAATAALKGGASARSIAADLLRSAEYDDDLATADYRTYLGRAASPAEVAAVASALGKGLTAGRLASSLMGSAEFRLIHPTDADFVQAAYRDILGRAASTAEVAAVSTQLTAGTARAAVVDSLLGSTEANVRAINGVYTTFLARVDDAYGLNTTTPALQAGTLTLADLASGLAGSIEFTGRANATVG